MDTWKYGIHVDIFACLTGITYLFMQNGSAERPSAPEMPFFLCSRWWKPHCSQSDYENVYMKCYYKHTHVDILRIFLFWKDAAKSDRE